MPVLLGRDAHLVQRERHQFVRFQVTADKGRDFLTRPVGNLGGMPDIAGELHGVHVLLGKFVPEKLLLHLVKVENTVAANDELAVGVLTQGKLAVVAVGKRTEVEVHTGCLVGLETFQHLVEHAVLFKLLPFDADGCGGFPVNLVHIVLVLRLLLLFLRLWLLLRCIGLLLLLPGGRLRLLLALLLCLLGRLYFVLCHAYLSFGRGILHGLLEICRYPLHFLFRDTEEMETGGIFNLIPEIGKEVGEHIAVAIHPEKVVVVLQRVLGL